MAPQALKNYIKIKNIGSTKRLSFNGHMRIYFIRVYLANKSYAKFWVISEKYTFLVSQGFSPQENFSVLIWFGDYKPNYLLQVYIIGSSFDKGNI